MTFGELDVRMAPAQTDAAQLMGEWSLVRIWIPELYALGIDNDKGPFFAETSSPGPSLAFNLMTPASSRNESGPFKVSTSIRDSLGTITMSCTVHSLSPGPLTVIWPPLFVVVISRSVPVAFG